MGICEKCGNMWNGCGIFPHLPAPIVWMVYNVGNKLFIQFPLRFTTLWKCRHNVCSIVFFVVFLQSRRIIKSDNNQFYLYIKGEKQLAA